MKRQLLWGVLLLAAGLSSCKKDSFKPVNDESGNGKSTKVNVVQQPYYYVDLVLQPRQPGETFDTYRCVFGGADVKVTGTLSWNSILYPTLKNGVPGLWATYYVDNNANTISSSISGGQDFFILSLGTTGYSNLQAFQSDVNKYDSARQKYEHDVENGDTEAIPPLVYNYVKNSYYTAPGGFTNITGKLIRVTTGSHWALATIDYPLPSASTTTTIPNSTFQITDPDHPTNTYFLDGVNGTISGGRLGGVTIVATGNYTYLGSATFHLQGRVYRSDGTYFGFDLTQDPS